MDLKLYVVVNQDGYFFRAKGYGGFGNSWVADVQKARIYAKIGPARSTVSYFAKEHPQFGIPEIHQLNVASTIILDEKDRVIKAIKAREKLAERRKKAQAEWQIKEAQAQVLMAEERLRKLKK